MGNVIKGLSLLKDVDSKTILEMEQAALVKGKQAHLDFKIIKQTDKTVVIRVSQDKEAEEFYNTQKLTLTVHETFLPFFPKHRIIVHPIPYKQSPAEVVTAEWVSKHMLEFHVSLKQLTEDTGLNKTYLSNLVNENKEFSQAMKAMFYFYFESKKNAPA